MNLRVIPRWALAFALGIGGCLVASAAHAQYRRPGLGGPWSHRNLTAPTNSLAVVLGPGQTVLLGQRYGEDIIDGGGEYTARTFQEACIRLGVTQSMGRPGSALDNAVIESWHSTLEFELRSLEHFETRAAARARVSAWIGDYNTRRRHSALGMMTPVGYEQALKAGKAA